MSISDQVVLLKDGTVQQIAQPQQLYDQPANRFTASFLGTPPICMVEGIARDGHFIVGDTEIRWPGMAGIPDGRNVVLGVRAEALRAAGEPEQVSFTAAIDSKYIIGRDSLAIIRLNDQILRFYLPEELADLGRGDRIGLTLRSKGVFLFDQETGDRLV